jgi:phosphoadenosine phosphosulfate reductase
MSDHLAHTRALLARAVEGHAAPVFATSFGAEDMVLFDLIARDHRAIEIATLDTGRLPPETYALIAATEAKYRRRVRVYFPEADAVEQYVRIHGINAFRDSVAQRKACCAVRKVAPLKRLLAGKDAWITGLRRGQSETRAQLAEVAFDPEHGLTKFNPLAQWSESEVWDYLRAHSVPYNALHDAGYPSIGCAPCTRAVAPGEPSRAGRWWWEAQASRECGLHTAADPPVTDSQSARSMVPEWTH